MIRKLILLSTLLLIQYLAYCPNSSKSDISPIMKREYITLHTLQENGVDIDILDLRKITETVSEFEGINNSLYIGYGHFPLSNETHLVGRKLSKYTMDSLLLQDIIRYTIPFKQYKYAISLGLIAYQYGVYSECIRILTKCSNIQELKSKWMKYVYYEGKIHKGFIARRSFELEFIKEKTENPKKSR